MTRLEASIKEEMDFQKKMLEKIEMWEWMQAQPEVEKAFKLIDDSDQIRELYNYKIEPFNLAPEEKDGKDSNN